MSQYGKFSSADELMRGYEQLERTFTQKCQQLARAEAQLATKQSATVDNDGTSPTQGVANADQAQQTADLAVNQLSTDRDSHGAQVGTLSNAVGTSLEPPTQDASTVPEEGDSSSLPSVDSQDSLIKDLQQLFANHPHLRQRLLQEQITHTAPQLMTGGGDVSLALPNRPRTVKEASQLARQLFD